ncbi:unnamed protein product [Leptidea sinapis]|uniref:Uncharacterized protein n=1 Tax=Leptidea sinapis TaxID=189913 RepID=A0A5E4QR84_9NEOP|nr:unnamed protein product [Leptidea sinapis]
MIGFVCTRLTTIVLSALGLPESPRICTRKFCAREHSICITSLTCLSP